MKYVHFSMTIQVNESDNSWVAPLVTHHINIDMPLPMFDEKKFAALVDAEIEQAKVEFPTAVLEYAKEKAEEAAKKEAEEAEKHLQELNV
jgi:hypothetical protein